MSKISAHIILVLSLFLFCNVLTGQQGTQSTQFMFNRYGFSAAYGGLESSLSITAGLRSQWSGFDGAPKTQFINAHLPLYFLSGSAGISIQNESLGPLVKTDLTTSYNYVGEMPGVLLSLGVKFGLSQVEIDGSRLVTPSGTYVDNAINHNDPILLSGDMRGSSIIYGFSLYAATGYGELGLSLDNVPVSLSPSGSSQFRQKQLFSLFYSYDIPLISQIVVSPILLVKSDFVQTQTDLGAIGRYNNIMGGLTIRGYNSRSIDAINFILGTKLNEHIRISYSYDFGISKLSSFHDNTHEFILNYNLNKKIRTAELPKIIYNPRFN